MKVRKALQNQAASVGEQGFKYAGMSAEMLLKVNEFATGLRDGVIELQPPPSELLKENRRLKDELQTMFAKLQNYEREIGGSLLGGGDWQLYLAAQQKQFLLQQQQQQQPSEATQQQQIMFAEEMKRLMEENAALHNKMSTLPADLLSVMAPQLQQQQPLPQDQQQLLIQQQQKQLQQMHELLTGHTERVMLELQGLKKSSHADLPPTGRTPMNSTRRGIPLDLTPIGGGGLGGLWTPAVGSRRDNPNLNFTQTMTGTMTGIGTMMGGPQTPHGKTLLNQTLQQLNLPPEEWAMDIRDVNSQLVECLEQLYEREKELEDQRSSLEAMEDNLVAVRQQARKTINILN